MENYFIELTKVNVNNDTKKIQGLTYVPWTTAWKAIKSVDPTANFRVYEDINGCFYHNDGRTGWVKVGVTVNGIEHKEYLAIMDYRNNSVPLEKITSKDAMNTIQRAITKACARHGLALYVYSGDGLPYDPDAGPELKKVPAKTSTRFVPNVYGD